jgi:hypothetical protein
MRLADPEYNQKDGIRIERKIDLLIDAGVFQPAKRGRKRLSREPPRKPWRPRRSR